MPSTPNSRGRPKKHARHEDESPQDGHGHRRTGPLDALEIADRDDVHRKENESRSEQRKPPDGNRTGGAGAVDEHGHDPAAEQRRKAEEPQSGRHGRQERQPEGLAHARAVSRTEIVAQNRLGRLPDGVVDHEDDREEVAGDAERRHAVLAQIADENVVPGEHHHGDGPLAEEGRKPQPAHVAHIAEGQAHALAARLHTAQAHDVAAASQVAEDHPRTHDITEARGQRRTRHAPAEDEDENVVQHDVDDRRNGVAKHRVVGRPVEPDEEHARA